MNHACHPEKIGYHATKSVQKMIAHVVIINLTVIKQFLYNVVTALHQYHAEVINHGLNVIYYAIRCGDVLHI